MGYSVKILKDSVGPVFGRVPDSSVLPANGPSGGTPAIVKPRRKRVTTWELTYPRMVHAELLTHKLFSRNSASSRAIPNEKMLKRIAEDPAMPVFWGRNQKGMAAAEEMSPAEIDRVRAVWLRMRDEAMAGGRELAALDLHKQICNRPTEPWMFITVILTATEFDNWFHLRDHKAAQPEIAWVATEMHKQYLAAEPQVLEAGEWHLPMIGEEDHEAATKMVQESPVPTVSVYQFGQRVLAILKKVSTGRCARVSYLTHDGKRDLSEDIALHDKLCVGPTLDPPQPGHWSPFEHVAQAMTFDQWNQFVGEELRRATDTDTFFDQTVLGNFIGWKQYRKEFQAEHFRGVSR